MMQYEVAPYVSEDGVGPPPTQIDPPELGPESTLRDRVVARLAQLHMSAYALGKQTGMSPQHAYGVVNGITKSLQPFTLRRYAEVLGVNPSWLQAGFGPIIDQEMQREPEAYLRAQGLTNEAQIALIADTIRLAKTYQARTSGGPDSEVPPGEGD